MNQQQADPGDHILVPQVVASYAAYLKKRTLAAPQATVTGEHAELSVTVGGKTLVLAFECRTREWSMHSAEIRRGELTAAYTRGQLARAVTALLAP